MTAMFVVEGKRDEEFEVTLADVEKQCCKWTETLERPPSDLKAEWDLDRAHFYLAHDGEHPALHPGNDYALIEVAVADVHEKLTYQSSRDKDSWDEQYRGRSLGTAFRWLNGLPVTPPLIARVGDEIAIVGGNHRYHLAHYYQTKRMPFLVLKENLASVLDLLPNAVRIEPAA
ncbi:hypothetical protein [Rhizobium terrae]|uniref:hypothetical protein n=1 Tax=Rhizobium terrae TaxID=2171756 RepID=UPI0013C2C003|nr:hypothetical protein [Rhizobium terrae]